MQGPQARRSASPEYLALDEQDQIRVQPERAFQGVCLGVSFRLFLFVGQLLHVPIHNHLECFFRDLFLSVQLYHRN